MLRGAGQPRDVRGLVTSQTLISMAARVFVSLINTDLFDFQPWWLLPAQGALCPVWFLCPLPKHLAFAGGVVVITPTW